MQSRSKVCLALVVSVLLLPPLVSFAGGQQEKKSAEKLVLEWTTWQVLEEAQKSMMTDFIEAFKKDYPNVEINLTGNPWSEYFDKLQVRMAGGSWPDIYTCSMDNFTRYARLNFAAPLSDYVDLSKYDFIDVADLTNIGGKTYGIVYLTLPFGLIYNKTILDREGLKPPTTPEELIEVGKKVTVGKEQFGYSGAVDPTNPADFWTELLVWTLGYDGKLAKQGMPTVNSPENVRAVQMLKKVYDSGIMPRGIDRQLYRKMLLSGKIVMQVDGPYFFDWARNESEEAFRQLDSAPPFFKNKAARTYTVYTCVSQGAKDKEIAARFVEFMLHPENQEQFVPRVKQTPAVRNVKIPEQWLQENQWFKGYLELNPKSVVPEGLDIYTEDMKKIAARYIGEVFLSNQDVKAAMDEAQQGTIDMLKAQGYKLPQ